MVLTDTAAVALDKVCLKTVGQLPHTRDGIRQILTMLCKLAKYCLAIAVPVTRVTTTEDFAREFLAVHSKSGNYFRSRDDLC